MTMNRRAFITTLATVAPYAYLTGCTGSPKSAMLPKPDWPSLGTIPKRPTISRLPKPAINPSAGTSAINPIPRAAWTRARPNLANINPLNGIRRITIHHEGSPSIVNFSDRQSSAMRLEQVRTFHRNGNGWDDIGYHFIIDRGGRVWEGRSIQYQGAHVKNNNENNVGVMVLGNFNLQHPSQNQLNSLSRSVRDLRQRYRIGTGSIKTHREITPTACPGANLQPRVDQMRSSGAFS